MRRPATGVVSVLACAAAAVAFGVASTPSSTASSSIPAVQARQADSLVDAVGVNTHLNYYSTAYGNYDAVKNALLRLGVRHVRDHMLTSDNTWKARVSDLAAAGVKFDMIMGDRPYTTASPGTFVNAVANNLPAGAVESLEGVNEWDTSGYLNWASLLRSNQKQLYAAAKANPATASLPVIAPSLARWQNYSALGSMKGMADVENAHLYPGGLPASFGIFDFLNLVNQYLPSAPTYFTEAGYHDALKTTSTHYPTSDDAAGVYMPNLVLEHFRTGTKRVYLYELANERPEPNLRDKEQHFGLVNNDFTPKPGYTSLQNLLNLVSDPGTSFTPGSLHYQVDGAPADLKQVLLQKRNGTFVLLMWRDISIWDRIAEALTPVKNATAKVTFGASHKVTVCRPATPGSTSTTSTGDSITVPLDDAVVALTIK